MNSTPRSLPHDTQNHNPEPRFIFPLRRAGLVDHQFCIDPNLLLDQLGEDDYRRLRRCHLGQVEQCQLAAAFREYVVPLILHYVDREEEKEREARKQALRVLRGDA